MWLRRLLRIPAARLSSQEALAIAKTECERRGWPWVEPVKVRAGLRSFRVWTNADAIGGNAIIDVDNQTGIVLNATLSPK